MAEDVRDRLLASTVVCLGRYGIAKTNLDDAAREAGVARATVYRHFPDGKEELIAAAIGWAVREFFVDMASSVDADAPFPEIIEQAIAHAYRAVDEHVVLQKVLETEPERLLPHLSQAAPQVTVMLGAYLAEKLEHAD
ncbi:MAG: TetR/AcrR family transcriptional regulator, partial [Acidimicrobiales bacterium]|nr:TetR/AcrR family transcriptional regulator [Acidimicrobiales bacterium]